MTVRGEVYIGMLTTTHKTPTLVFRGSIECFLPKVPPTIAAKKVVNAIVTNSTSFYKCN